MGEKIHIFDTTLRDGEQVPGCQLDTPEKVQLALELEKLGVDVIEAGFPVSSPGDFRSVEAISKVLKEATVCALTRANRLDIDVAARALHKARRKRIHTGIGSSDIHIEHKFRSTREQVMEQGIAAVAYAKKFCEDVEFYAEDAGRADILFLSKMVEGAIAAGATVINIPDTTGYCLPEEYGEKIRFLMENVRGIQGVILSCHCHNDLGLATANSIAGIRNGARQVECTMNGIGERAGNTSLEEVVMILKSHKDLDFETGIIASKLCPLSKMVSGLMNMQVQANKAIVGKNAFAHSSGIHQDGFLKNPQTYEIINPKDVGAGDSSILLTARSGRAALDHCLKKAGYSFDRKELTLIYDQFLRLADKEKEVVEEDLHKLVEAYKLTTR